MPWTEKHTPTGLDGLPIHGLYYLDGDVLARSLILQHSAAENLSLNPDWLKNQKLPQIEFPSGLSFDLWESSADAEATVHLFGEMDVSYRSTRDEALAHAQRIAELIGYGVRPRGEALLDIWRAGEDERFTVTYDNENRRMVNVEQLIEPVERPVHPAHELLNETIARLLPPLYSNEHIGLEAMALVKYFTPDSSWTWYASEGSPVDENGYFDTDDKKVDYLLFGLVIGFEIEFGYFSLNELQPVRGALGLPVERDLYYEPKSLRELQDQHRRERGEM
jgi:hypothetical protein